MSTVVESLLISLGFDADTSGAKGFMGAMDGVVGKALSIASVIGGIFTANSFIKTASTFEQLETQLTTIQGSSEKAKESMNWISEFAAETPYELQQVAEAFVKLQSYGMDAQEGGLLESIGNMASGMNKSLDQAVEAVADAVTGENERLKEFGIRAEKDKKTKETTYTYMIDNQAMTKTASKAPEDIQRALQEIMDERFKDAMKTRAKTWEGTLSNMADIWQMFQLKVMNAGVFDALKDKLNRFMMWIVENKKKLDEWAKAIGEMVTHVFKRIDSVIDWFTDWAKDLGITEEALTVLKVTLGYVASALLGLAAAKAAIAVIRGIAMAVAIMTSPLTIAAAALGLIILLIDDYLTYKEGGDSVFGDLIKQYPEFKQFVDFVGAAFDAIKTHAKVLAVVIGILTAAFIFMKTQALISFIATRVMAIASFTMIAAQAIASAVATAAAWLIAFAPFVLLAAFVAGAIFAFWWLYENWDEVWSKIADYAGEKVETIKEKIAAIGAYFSKIAENIKSAWESAIGYISGLFDSLLDKWDTVKDYAKKAVGWGDESRSQGQSMIPYRMTPPGNTSVTQTVNVNVPTAAAAGDAVMAMGNSARNTVSKSQAGLRQ